MFAFKFVLSIIVVAFAVVSVDAQIATYCGCWDACDLTKQIRGIVYGVLIDSCKNVFQIDNMANKLPILGLAPRHDLGIISAIDTGCNALANRNGPARDILAHPLATLLRLAETILGTTATERTTGAAKWTGLLSIAPSKVLFSSVVPLARPPCRDRIGLDKFFRKLVLAGFHIRFGGSSFTGDTNRNESDEEEELSVSKHDVAMLDVMVMLMGMVVVC